MASLKKEFGEKVKFYFVEYNQENAKPVIEKYNIQSHPMTYILNKDDQVIFTLQGFDSIGDGKKALKEQIEKALQK